MAHKQQADFCLSVKARFPAAFTGKRVLEVGSLNINGSCRELFQDCEYLGIDVVPGRDVDLVVPAHLHGAADGSYDTIISCEAEEHDQMWMLTLPAMLRMLCSGGILCITCATIGRHEHGTRRTTPHDAPGLPWPDYYRNLTEDDLRWGFRDMGLFAEYAFSVGVETCDLYFWGKKR